MAQPALRDVPTGAAAPRVPAARGRNTTMWLGIVAGLPAAIVLIAFFAWPIARIIVLSFQDSDTAALTLGQYANLATDPYYVRVALSTLWITLSVVALSLLLGYPAAYYLVRSESRYKSVLLVAMIAPLLVSIVVRTLGWLMLLGDQGPVASLLRAMPGVGDPGQLLFNRTAVIVGIVHILVPFMILTIAGSIAGIDRRLEETAAVAGASPVNVFLRVTLPLSMPGIASGCVLVFSLTVGVYVTPIFLGGGRVLTIASAIYEETITLLNWPQAAALSTALLAVVLVLFSLSLYGVQRRFGARGRG